MSNPVDAQLPRPLTGKDRPPRRALIAALGLAVAAVAAVIVVASRANSDQPVTLQSLSNPSASSPDCRAFTAALPTSFGSFHQVSLTQPAPESAAAWRTGPHSAPVVVRCGLERPPGFVMGSPLQVVDEVQWFQTDDRAHGSPWYAVDRRVYIALTLPPQDGPTPIQELSEIIAKTLPAVPIHPAPAQ